ncbi:MAG: beta-ketoacyl synthase [Planctomyces sp.]|nr:beta-ketoacyl synthase [Planctomyces sp.]
MPHDPVIIGLGSVSPFGTGVGAYIAGLRAGVSAVRPLPAPHPAVAARVAAWIGPEQFTPSDHVPEADLKRLPRLVPMALAAARQAMAHAGMPPDRPATAAARRIGLILGTGGGGIDFTLDQAAAIAAGRSASLWTITNATHGNLAGELSIRLGLRGPSWCVSDGCASSSDALGLARHLLRDVPPDAPGAIDAALVVGADAHVRWETLHTMELLGVIDTRDPLEAGGPVPRPFDATRAGFALGEGAWAVLLARPAAAAGRERPALAAMTGFAATCDAFHRVRPDPDMTESARAIELAVADARLRPDQVAIAHLHGTGTKLNDALETAAVRAAFGPHAVHLVCHSIKGALGHPQGASGIAALVATLGAVLGLDGGAPFTPATANLRAADPACGLDCTPLAPRPLAPNAPRTILVNCLAFGAKNSAIVLQPTPERPTPDGHAPP